MGWAGGLGVGLWVWGSVLVLVLVSGMRWDAWRQIAQTIETADAAFWSANNLVGEAEVLELLVLLVCIISPQLACPLTCLLACPTTLCSHPAHLCLQGN